MKYGYLQTKKKGLVKSYWNEPRLFVFSSIGFHEFKEINGVEQLLNFSSFTEMQKIESNAFLECDQFEVCGILYKAATDSEA